MQNLPHLGPRAVRAYNRLAQDIATFNYIVRVAKPSGIIGDTTRRSMLASLRAANRLFKREPSRPHFPLFDPIVPMSLFDFALYVARLSAASIAFEERHAHLTAIGLARDAQASQSVDLDHDSSND
jgi:hypothetical protein